MGLAVHVQPWCRSRLELLEEAPLAPDPAILARNRSSSASREISCGATTSTRPSGCTEISSELRAVSRTSYWIRSAPYGVSVVRAELEVAYAKAKLDSVEVGESQWTGS